MTSETHFVVLHLDQQYSNEGQADEVDIVDQFIAGENIAREKRQTEETANEQPSISFPRLLSRLSEIRLEVFQCARIGYLVEQIHQFSELLVDVIQQRLCRRLLRHGSCAKRETRKAMTCLVRPKEVQRRRGN